MTMRDQVGALCVQATGQGILQIALITSRNSGRWIIPKGWPHRYWADWRAAEREALEEAGLEGAVSRDPVGTFNYHRKKAHAEPQLLRVSAFLLFVEREHRSWPEEHERERRWFSIEAAAQRVDEKGLALLIRRVPKLVAASAHVEEVA